jgi:hypothetical protein
VRALLILDFGTRWGWVVSVTPRPRFSPAVRTPSNHCTGGWVGPRARRTQRLEEKYFRLYQGSNLDRPVCSQALYGTDWATVRVTLRLTVSQSVSLGVEPLLGLMTRFLVLYNDYCSLWPLGAPSLTRGCHLSEAFVLLLCRVRIFTTLYTPYTIRYVQYVQGLCQSRLREADYALSYLTCVMTTANHLNDRRPDRRWATPGSWLFI